MELKAGYKRTAIGLIPQEWDVKSFDDLFDFRNGVNAEKQAYGQGVPFINVLEPITYSHIYGPEISGRIMLSESLLNSYAVRHGDVLFNRTSETQEEVGLASAYLGSEQVVFGGFVICGRPKNDSLDPLYSGYALRAPSVRSQIIPMGQGAIRANISQHNLKLVLALVPAPAEQGAIATALRDVDELLKGIERLIAKKHDLKQAAMQQLLSGQTRLPGFSGEWQPKTLGALGTIYGGLTGKTKGDFGDGDGLYVTFMNVMSNVRINCESFERVRIIPAESQNRVQKGDLLLNGSSETPEEVALCSVVDKDVPDLFLNSFCFGFRFYDEAQADALFIALYLRSREGREIIKLLAQGSTRYNLSKPALLKSIMRLPEPKEQIAIAAVLTDMDTEMVALEQRLAKTRDLKQAMMQELLTGKTRLVTSEAIYA